MYDLMIKNCTIIDGSGSPRYSADIGISGGKIKKIGSLSAENAAKVIDAAGAIVAPGVIDVHTHYDVQIHWDPYCTSSGWHGTTTVAFSNCGFGLAPCRDTPEDQERYMRMMETTEQLPYEAQKKGLSWEWSTFPEWMAFLRALPKGVNTAVYLPLNALLAYVIGPDESKRRRATEVERRVMRELLNEAMDAGASGFSLSWLGAEGNSHVDFDHSPMPTDIMDPEDAYNLCDVLRERDEGIIQVLCEVPPNVRRSIAEGLAQRSGRPVLHNLLIASEGHPEFFRDTMRWLEDMNAKGLRMFSQGVTYNFWNQFKLDDYNSWDAVPVFRTLSVAGDKAAKAALARDPAYRQRMRNEFDSLEYHGNTTGRLEEYVLQSVPGAARFQRYEGWSLSKVATDLKQPLTDVFLDICAESDMQAEVVSLDGGGSNYDYIAEILRHPFALPGVSDGGAHMKTFCGGQWSTEMIIKLVREKKIFTLEEIHFYISGKTAALFGFESRGVLKEGYAADIMIYDFDKLTYSFGKFERRFDLPGGDWRFATPVHGIKNIIVNGVMTFENGVCTNAVPGQVVVGGRANVTSSVFEASAAAELARRPASEALVS